jgi:hypothetical protein
MTGKLMGVLHLYVFNLWQKSFALMNLKKARSAIVTQNLRIKTNLSKSFC